MSQRESGDEKILVISGGLVVFAATYMVGLTLLWLWSKTAGLTGSETTSALWGIFAAAVVISGTRVWSQSSAASKADRRTDPR